MPKVEGKTPSVLKHRLVPKHEILRKEEAERVLVQYHATADQLPRILASDPVIKELGAKAGDIVRIERISRTAGTTIYYRYVVEGEL